MNQKTVLWASAVFIVLSVVSFLFGYIYALHAALHAPESTLLAELVVALPYAPLAVSLTVSVSVYLYQKSKCGCGLGPLVDAIRAQQSQAPDVDQLIAKHVPQFVDQIKSAIGQELEQHRTQIFARQPPSSN